MCITLDNRIVVGAVVWCTAPSIGNVKCNDMWEERLWGWRKTNRTKFPLHWCIFHQTSLKLLCKASAMTAIAPMQPGLKVGGFVYASALTLTSSSFQTSQNVFHSTIFRSWFAPFFSSFFFSLYSYVRSVCLCVFFLLFYSLASFSMRVFHIGFRFAVPLYQFVCHLKYVCDVCLCLCMYSMCISLWSQHFSNVVECYHCTRDRERIEKKGKQIHKIIL